MSAPVPGDFYRRMIDSVGFEHLEVEAVEGDLVTLDEFGTATLKRLEQEGWELVRRADTVFGRRSQ